MHNQYNTQIKCYLCGKDHYVFNHDSYYCFEHKLDLQIDVSKNSDEVKARIHEIQMMESLAKYIPSTLQDAVEWLDKLIHENIKKLLAKISIVNIQSVNFSVGLMLREKCKLWEKDCPLKKFFKSTYDISHPEDITNVIISHWHSRLNGEKVDVPMIAKSYRDFRAKIQEAFKAGKDFSVKIKVENNYQVMAEIL